MCSKGQVPPRVSKCFKPETSRRDISSSKTHNRLLGNGKERNLKIDAASLPLIMVTEKFFLHVHFMGLLFTWIFMRKGKELMRCGASMFVKKGIDKQNCHKIERSSLIRRSRTVTLQTRLLKSSKRAIKKHHGKLRFKRARAATRASE
jgi:hypothetical protein